MADSAITVASLNVAGGAGQNLVTFTTSGGGPDECLPYLNLAKVEIYAATTNDRSTATKVGEGLVSVVHAGLGVSVTRYYWARAVDVSGLVGEWYPLSETAGIPGTTSNQVPPAGSVGTPQLQDGAVTSAKIGDAQITTAKIGDAQITNAKIVDVSAGKLTAGTVTVTLTLTAPVVNGGTLNGSRLVVSSGNISAPVASLSASAQAGVSSIFVNQSGNTGESAILVNNLGSGASCHGGRFRHLGVGGPSGGSGLIGVPPVGGSWAFYAEAGNYGPFTGAHDAFVRKDSDLKVGDIVVDKRVIVRKDMSNTITEVVKADAVAMKAVLGVVVSRFSVDEEAVMASFVESKHTACNFLRRYAALHFDRVVVNAIGEGQIFVCGRAGDIEPGDLVVSSDLAGTGQRQADDLMRASTVAKVREAVTFSDPDEVKLVACTYHCG